MIANVRLRLNRHPPKLLLSGAIICLIGLTTVLIDLNIGRSQTGVWGMMVFIIGVLVMFLGLKKRTRKKIANMLDPCQYCRCTNCGLRHNHWTHD